MRIRTRVIRVFSSWKHYTPEWFCRIDHARYVISKIRKCHKNEKITKV